LHVDATGFEKNMQVHIDELWKATQSAAFSPSSFERANSEITVEFDIPADAVLAHANPTAHRWELTVTSEDPRIQYHVGFAWTHSVPI